MNILLLSGSLQRNSLNTKNLKAIQSILKRTDLNVQVEQLDLKTLNIPLYDGDVENEKGVPESILFAVQKIKSAHGLIISSPEYNGSISGVLKNFIDWTSRVSPHPWTKKPLLLTAATPGPMAALRGLWHTRVPLEVLGTILYSEVIGVPKAHESFDEQSEYLDSKFKSKMEMTLKGYLEFVQKLNSL